MEIELAESENIDVVMDFYSVILDTLGNGAEISSEENLNLRDQFCPNGIE